MIAALSLDYLSRILYNTGYNSREWGIFVLIYIDESGSINNHYTAHCPYFVIALVHVLDKEKTLRAYKRFVSSNIKRLRELDQNKIVRGGKVREGGKMFQDGKFKELKGTQFDAEMKKAFLKFFSENKLFEVFFIKLDNSKLSDTFCSNTARAFNYPLKLALGYYIRNGLLPNEECLLQLDERNERTETKHFLGTYLNTELILSEGCNGPFSVRYFDSADNRLIQIADVYANWYYSQLFSHAYDAEMKQQQEKGIIKEIFEFPRY